MPETCSLEQAYQPASSLVFKPCSFASISSAVAASGVLLLLPVYVCVHVRTHTHACAHACGVFVRVCMRVMCLCVHVRTSVYVECVHVYCIWTCALLRPALQHHDSGKCHFGVQRRFCTALQPQPSPFAHSADPFIWNAHCCDLIHNPSGGVLLGECFVISAAWTGDGTSFSLQ